MKYKKEIYENWNPFEGDDDSDVKLYSWKLVKTRKAHYCCLAEMIGEDAYHEIQSGAYAMREHAVVDGEWASTYSCMGCMDKWMEEMDVMGYFDEEDINKSGI